GIPLHRGSQRSFTKIIRKLKPKPLRKSPFVNLDRIRCAVGEISNYTPSDRMIWKSVRSTTLQRLTREFYWKCIHNTFRVGDFWLHIDPLSIRAECQTCRVPDSLDHIALECNSRSKISMGFNPTALVTEILLMANFELGCNLVTFRSEKGIILPEKARLFAILVSTGWHLIWQLRRERVIENPDRIHSESEIHNRWLKTLNRTLVRDRLLTNKIKFGSLAFNRQLVLSRWSGILANEDSLPEDWIHEGVLVGMRPMTYRQGIG
ncbi:hypothetical protein C8R45DRAFT_1176752, partial [Mycena sanguinolenta]